MGLAFEVLGTLRVRGDEVVPVERPSHRRLLSILLLEAGRRQSTDALIDRFWDGQPPDTAKAAMQTHVSALRRLLPEPAIVTEGYGYRLVLDAHRVDARDFADAAGRARDHASAGAWESALREAEGALGLWRGTPFPELCDDDFARPEIGRLEELHIGLSELRAEALLALDRTAEALPELERLTRAHPLRERAWEQMMLARHRLGRQAEALEAYQQARTALSEIGLEPGEELRRLEARVLRGDVDEGSVHLPGELTSFVGRGTELAEVLALLRDHRIVTLTGVGGAGKTRLALRVADRARPLHPDGCWFVPLAALTDPALVASQVAGTLGVLSPEDAPEQVLRAAASDRESLVVLDNCEHLVESAARVAHLLATAGRGVRVLATSREPLGITGEVVYDVPPMTVPSPGDGGDPDVVRRADAVRLFEERARLVRPGYGITARDADAVATICRRLDGVPLAIELAAARTRVLEPRTIAERLDDRFRLLTGGGEGAPPRQRTLEATVAWSYDLLAPAEQRVFRRLSAFHGSFDLAMAEEVTGVDLPAGEVVDLVGALVDRSLVTSEESPVGRRYRLLETLRQYGQARLLEHGEAEAVRRAHRRWFVRFAEEVSVQPPGAGLPELAARLGVDIDDVQAALDAPSSEATDVEDAVLHLAIADHWARQGHLALATRHLERAVEVAPAGEDRIRALGRLAGMRFAAGEVDEAFALASRAVATVEGGEPSLLQVEVLLRLARLYLLNVDRSARDGVPLARRARQVARSLGQSRLERIARATLGDLLGWGGDLDEGLAHRRAVLEMDRADGDLEAVIEQQEPLYNLLYLHPVERREGPVRAREEFLGWVAEHGDEGAVQRAVDAVPWLTYVALQVGDLTRAEEQITRFGERHLEGYDWTYHAMQLATLRWMQGRLDDARRVLDELWGRGVNPRWYHDYFPLCAEVAAERCELGEARRVADAYVAVEVHPSEETKKLGVLAPLVRAEVDASLAGAADERGSHLARADAAVARMRDLLERHPPPTGGSVQLETHHTHLAVAEAERSRADGPDPDRWREAVGRADYLYTRLYASWRLAEALAAAGAHHDAARVRDAAHIDAVRAGMDRLRVALEAVDTAVAG